MLIVKIKQGESIEKALKILKSKVVKTKQNQILFDNRDYTKKSEIKRAKILKAKFVQKKKDKSN
jgi:small subunit ribosomal protein S21